MPNAVLMVFAVQAMAATAPLSVDDIVARHLAATGRRLSYRGREKVGEADYDVLTVQFADGDTAELYLR